MPKHRQKKTCSLILSEAKCQRLVQDNSLRIMLYCAVARDVLSQAEQVITFPHQADPKFDVIRVNREEVRANLKGLKKKPGTTKPADLTSLIRKQAGFNNEVLFTYAQTTQDFYFIVYLVRTVTAKMLAARLQTGKIITKERVLQESKSRLAGIKLLSLKTDDLFQWQPKQMTPISRQWRQSCH